MDTLKLNLTYEILVPAAVLIALFLLFAGMLVYSQFASSSKFDIGNFLRDEQGKESSTRAFGFLSLAVHTWWVITLVFQKTATLDHFIWYGVIWAGTPVIMVLAHRWGGNLPLAQPGYPPTVPSPMNQFGQITQNRDGS